MSEIRRSFKLVGYGERRKPDQNVPPANRLQNHGARRTAISKKKLIRANAESHGHKGVGTEAVSP